MKTFIMMFLVASGLSAHAAPVSCTGNVGRDTWSVWVNSDHQTAEVAKNGVAVQFGALSCQALASIPELEVRPFLECHSVGVADAGYSVVLSADRQGNTTAKLERNTFAGHLPVGDLACVVAIE